MIYFLLNKIKERQGGTGVEEKVCRRRRGEMKMLFARTISEFYFLTFLARFPSTSCFPF